MKAVARAFRRDLNAANSLLDRGYGRPSQSLEMCATNSDPDQTEVKSPREIIEARLALIHQILEANPFKRGQVVEM
jgi:hypothetical protein